MEETRQRGLVEQQVWKLAKAQESMCKQKSRVNWLRNGDLNTKFFHLVSKIRAKKNNMEELMCDGVWVEDPEIVKKKTMHFFKDIFKEEFLSDVNLENLPFCTLDNVESS